MQVKIFQASGGRAIEQLDCEINGWLSGGVMRDVTHVNTAMCQVADDGHGERWQHLVVTIWYNT